MNTKSISALESLDTTKGSIIHLLFAGRTGSRRHRKPHPFIAYASTFLVTFVPLFILGTLETKPFTETAELVRLSFLADWNALFIVAVSLPLLTAFASTDQHLLTNAIARLINEDILIITVEDGESLRKFWEPRFARINLLAQIIGVLTGGILVYANYGIFSPSDVGLWWLVNGKLVPAGIYMLFCIFLFYFVVPVYVVRSYAIILFLYALVKTADIRVVPFHPDHCGGLRPVGSIGLRHQYALSAFGINILLFVIISTSHLAISTGLLTLLVTAIVAYVLLGPFVFLGPLLPFRAGMLKAKNEMMNMVGLRLRTELTRIGQKIISGAVTKNDEELIERLRKIGTLFDELPVWPFDSRTLRRFVTAYVVPIGGSLAYAIFSGMLALFFEKMRH